MMMMMMMMMILAYHSLMSAAGTLSYDGAYSIQWDAKETKYAAKSSYKGRGMELSELINWQGRNVPMRSMHAPTSESNTCSKFAGKLLTIDDKTGIVYEIRQRDGVDAKWTVLEGDGSAGLPPP